MNGYLYLENGMEFVGTLFGCTKNVVGEVVFNTSMTGYQEILTDPSYYGQSVVMTYPLIGNYGINLEDHESGSIKVSALIVSEFCKQPNNHRYEISIDDYMKTNGIVGIEGIDTRALTLEIRNKGTMRGIITSKKLDQLSIDKKLESYQNTDAVSKVSRRDVEVLSKNLDGANIAVLDFGIKKSILKNFVKRNCNVTIFPYDTKPSVIKEGGYDYLFLSNGPGDPRDLTEVVENLKELVGKIKIIGICLGHQLITLATGGTIEKMKFGHRGGNHSVKDLKSGKIYITSQNHGYCVEKPGDGFVVTHINVNDKTIEGLENLDSSIKTVQHHPESCPGPYESEYIFDEFLKL